MFFRVLDRISAVQSVAGLVHAVDVSSASMTDAATRRKYRTLVTVGIILLGLFGHSGDDEVWSEGTKAMLDDMHKRKIDMADEIYVINVGGYIGDSTRSEIEYAGKTGKKVRYLEEEYSDECNKPVP